MKYGVFILLILIVGTKAFSQQAELHIKNNSSRTLTVKVMKENAGERDAKHALMVVPSFTGATEYFGTSGNYYLKTKVSLSGKATIYKKGNPFEVYVGRDGYSVLTVTFTINESTVSNPMEGEEISKEEFEEDH